MYCRQGPSNSYVISLVAASPPETTNYLIAIHNTTYISFDSCNRIFFRHIDLPSRGARRKRSSDDDDVSNDNDVTPDQLRIKVFYHESVDKDLDVARRKIVKEQVLLNNYLLV